MPGASKLYKPYFITDFGTHIVISFLEEDQCNLDVIKQRHDDMLSFYLISRETYESNQLCAALKDVFSHYTVACNPNEFKSFSTIKLTMSDGSLLRFLELLMPVFGYDCVTLVSVK